MFRITFFPQNGKDGINHPLLLELPYLRIKPKTQGQQRKKWYPIKGSRSSKTIPYQAVLTYLAHPYMGLSPPPPKTSRVTWQANMDLDDECQVIHEFSVVKCCFCYLNILEFKHDSYLFGDVTGSFMSFIKAILVGHVIKQGTKFIAEDIHVWPKKMLRRCYVQTSSSFFMKHHAYFCITLMLTK